jgi:SPP1 family phage portal protein
MAKKGITKIKIPVRHTEVSIEKIEPYLDTIFSQFENNAKEIRDDYDMYCLDHPILTKVRPHDDTEVNNIVLIPQLKSIIDWKTGYVFGNPIKYAQNKSSGVDDIQYLNKYVRHVCQRAVDKEVGKWAYATGVGYYFVEPKSEAFDIENEAPYEVFCRESDTCAKVYSAFNGNKPLFDMLYTTYTELKKDKTSVEVKVLDIYLPEMLYTYERRIGDKWVRKNEQPRGLYKKLPLVEKRLGSDGIGIVAMGKTMQQAIDTLISNGIDNIEDIVNEVWVYYNTLLGKTADEQAQNHRTAKKNGALVLSSTNPETPAKVETITSKLSISEVRGLCEMINSMFHSTVGVPMEMSSTNSGNTTKQGSEVANGYDNAYNRALDDINTFILADTDLLDKIMWICKNTPNNKIDSLATSEIEIKYSINLTDNIQVKAQAYGTLIQTMPPAMALRICRLSNDPEAEGKIIEDFLAKKASEKETQVVQEPKVNNGESL